MRTQLLFSRVHSCVQMKETPAAVDSQSHEALCNVQLSLKVCFDSETGGTASATGLHE